jgi:hypothetical protein
MRYDQGGKMATNIPNVELQIVLSTPNPTEEELKAAILAALSNSEFVSKLHHAHTTSRTVNVTTTQEEFNKTQQ